jgi:hypothetical protein
VQRELRRIQIASLPRVTGALLDEPRTLGRRADAVVASVLADLLDPEW